MAWAFACLAIAGLRKRVIRCLSIVVIIHILPLVVILVYRQHYKLLPEDLLKSGSIPE